MFYEKFNLKKEFPQLKNEDNYEPTLSAYVLDNSKEMFPDLKRPTVIICPGGGYQFTSDREAEPIAMKFLSEGFNAFVLRYSVQPAVFPQPLMEVSAAFAFVRRNAEKWSIDPENISVCGFSAGGHLAASIGVLWDNEEISKKLDLKYEENRPNAMILSYAVISKDCFPERDISVEFLGNSTCELSKMALELDKYVNAKTTPPAFLWHTFDDNVVPVENSLVMANALRKEKVPFEMHIYAKGLHGLSLANELTGNTSETGMLNKEVSTWIDLCINWLKLR